MMNYSVSYATNWRLTNHNWGSLSVGHYELCRDDIGIYLEAPNISD